MKKAWLFIVILLVNLLTFPIVVSAQNAVDSKIKTRPKVGLVMSGGGAKGFAYIGLIKVMHEAGLEVDYVAGSSMGSIIAGFYALGYDPDTMIKVIREQNWDDLLTDKINRKYIAYEEMEYGETYILSLPVTKKGVNIKSALYEGQEVNMLLNRFYSPAYKTSDFSQFQTPFFCIGTDLITGNAVVLDKGYLPMAIRSSMSIPGYFTPTLYDNKYLVDGGVVDNYPVGVAKQKGAQFIIGGDVQSGLYTNISEMNTIPSVLDQLIGFHRVNANEIGYKETNFYVHFKMPYGMMEFDSYDSIIALGERVAREHYPEIKKLADSLNAIEYKPIKEYNTRPLDSIYISNVVIEGNKRVPNSYFENMLDDFENSWVKLDELEEKIQLMYGSRFFDYVFYEFQSDGNKTNLLIKVEDVTAGSLSVGAHYDNDYSVSILLNGAFRNVLGKSSKIFTDVVVGPNPRLRALYFRDNGGKLGYGGQIDMYYFGFNDYGSSTDPNALVGRIFFTNYTASLFASTVIQNTYKFRAGATYEYFRFKSKLEGDLPDSLSNFNSYANLFFSFNSDSRNKPYLSTKGVISELKAEYVLPLSKDWVDQLFSNSLVVWFKYRQWIPLSKKITFIPGIFLGGTYSKNYPYSSDIYDKPYSLSPTQHWFYLGGQAKENYLSTIQPFTGVDFIQRYGIYQAIVNASIQYNFYKKMYFTLIADVGANEWYLKDIFQGENLIVGYGGTVSYDSFIGPVEVSMMGSNIHKVSFFFSLGYWF